MQANCVLVETHVTDQNPFPVTFCIFRRLLVRRSQEGELVIDENEPELIPPEHVMVDNVVRDPRVKFFGIPKLGAYLALPITYGSWLHPGGKAVEIRAGVEQRDTRKIETPTPGRKELPR